MAEGLDAEKPAASDTTRFSNPFFLASFGDYELLKEVARGGMGVIYKAKQKSLDRTVAIKVLASGEFASPEYVKRFKAEAAAAAKLQHPNIVAVHEVGQHEGIRYFTMDFVDGPNLSQLMAGRTLAPERAARYLKTLADAIHYAHQQGILHRDLKPSNVLIDPFDEPRVTDFGLARELERESDLTETGQVLGTPGYLPPEQADTTHGRMSPAADVYSLGAILYYMLTARAPFVSGSLRETIRQVLEDEPVPPRLLNPEVPADLETICLKCLQREPNRRYESAAALSEDLRRFMGHEPIVARPVSAVWRFSRWCRRKPALASVWLLVLTLAVVSTVSAFWISGAREEAEQALVKIRLAENTSQENLRQARLAEARAVRRTTTPGRRAQALSAIGQAAHIRRGPDLRDEALAALLVSDISPVEKWDAASGAPSTVTFDPGGTVAAVRRMNSEGSEQRAAILFPWGGKEALGKLSFETTNRAVGPLRFSQDAKLVMARCLDGALRIWRVGETAPFLELAGRELPGGKVLTEAFNSDYGFTPDGAQFVLGVTGKGVSLHRVSDGAEISRCEPHRAFTTLLVSPDGQHVAGVNISRYQERLVSVFTLPDLVLTNTFTLKDSPEGITWSSDGRLLAVSSADTVVSLFDIETGFLVRTLPCPGLGEGELISVGNDTLFGFRAAGSTFRLVNAALGYEELEVVGLGPSPLAARAGGSNFVMTSMEAVATRWQVQPPVGFHIIPPPRPTGYEMGFNSCCLDFSPDGEWVATTHGRFTLLRNVESGRLEADLDEGDPQGLEYATVAFCNQAHSLLRCSSRSGLVEIPLLQSRDGRRFTFGKERVLDPEPGFLISDHTADAARLVLVNPNDGRVNHVEHTEAGLKVLSRSEAPDV